MADTRVQVCSKEDIRGWLRSFVGDGVLGLSSGRIRVLVCGRDLTAEGQLELVGDFRPEFAEDVETHVLEDAVAYPLRCSRETALAIRVVGVVQHDCARGAQPFGKIKHACAIVAMSYNGVLHRVKQTLSGGAVGEAVVARVL